MKNEVLTIQLLVAAEAIQKFNKGTKINKVKVPFTECSIQVCNSKLLLNSIVWEGGHQLFANIQVCNTEDIKIGFLGLEALIKALKKFDSYTSLSIENGNFVATDGKKKVTLKISDYKEVLDIDFEDGRHNIVDGIEFKTAYDKVKKSIAPDELRPILTGIHFKDSFIETVDGFRVSQIKLNNGNCDFGDMVIPNTYIDIIPSIAKKNKSTAELFNTDKNYRVSTSFSNMEICLNGSLMNGEFLKSEQIFNNESDIEIEIKDKTELLNEIEFMSGIIGSLDSRKNPIVLNINKDKIEMYAKLEDSMTSTNVSIRSDIKDNLKIAFNNRFLIDAIKNIEGEFTMCFNSPLRPLIIKNDIERYLILPIRLANEIAA